MESNPGSSEHSLSSPFPGSDRDDARPPQPGDRLSQLCLGILQFLRSDIVETHSVLPHAAASIRAEAERQLVPILESTLHSVTTKMRQELMSWLQMVQNLEQLGNPGSKESPAPVLQPAESRQLSSWPAPELIIPQDPQDLFLPQQEKVNGASFDDNTTRKAEPKRRETTAQPTPTSSADTIAVFGLSPQPASPAPTIIDSPEDTPLEDTTSERQAEYLREAEQLAERGYHARALECCGKAILLAPDTATPYFRRGRIHLLRGDAERALKDLTTAIQLRGDDPEAYLFRGNLWVEYGEFPQALRDYSKALKLDPRSSAAFENRAWVHAKQQDWPEAIRDASSALDLDPGSSEALFIRGTAYSNLHQDREALADLNELLQLNPEHANGYNERGKVNTRLRYYDEAIADYEAALHLKPDFMTASYNRAMVLGQTGESERALAAFTELIQTVPGNAILHYQRGRLHLSRGEPGAAIADLERALEFKPRFLEAIKSLREAKKLLEPSRTPSAAVVEVVLEASDFVEDSEEPAPDIERLLEEPKFRAKSQAAIDPPSQPSREESEESIDPPCDATLLETKPTAPTQPENRTGGKMELICKWCGASRQIPLDRLNRQYQCQKCQRIFYVAQNGSMVEVKSKNDRGNWQDHRSKIRWLMAVVLLFGVFLGGKYLWRHTMGKGGPALPNELEPRVKLLAEAWLRDDLDTMRQLTVGAQGRRMRFWMQAHPSPLSAQDRELSKRRSQTTIEMHIANEKRDAVQLDLSVNHPLMGQTSTMKQDWVKEGDTWFFKPFP